MSILAIEDRRGKLATYTPKATELFKASIPDLLTEINGFPEYDVNLPFVYSVAGETITIKFGQIVFNDLLLRIYEYLESVINSVDRNFLSVNYGSNTVIEHKGLTTSGRIIDPLHFINDISRDILINHYKDSKRCLAEHYLTNAGHSFTTTEYFNSSPTTATADADHLKSLIRYTDDEAVIANLNAIVYGDFIIFYIDNETPITIGFMHWVPDSLQWYKLVLITGFSLPEL